MMLKNCAICRKPAVEKYSPFCSARCADVDLGRWLGEAYKMPTEEGPNDIKNPQEGPDPEE